MKTVKTLEIDGTSYAIPDTMTDNKLADIAGALLLLRRVDYCCGNEYRASFHWPEADSVRVRLGTKQLYETEVAAREARDAHNAAQPKEAETV
jgi:hypothetical protein